MRHEEQAGDCHERQDEAEEVSHCPDFRGTRDTAEIVVMGLSVRKRYGVGFRDSAGRLVGTATWVSLNGVETAFVSVRAAIEANVQWQFALNSSSGVVRRSASGCRRTRPKRGGSRRGIRVGGPGRSGELLPFIATTPSNAASSMGVPGHG
jgi:hypothetical protein